MIGAKFLCLQKENLFQFEFPGEQKNSNFSSQKTYHFQIWGNEAMILADYKD